MKQTAMIWWCLFSMLILGFIGVLHSQHKPPTATPPNTTKQPPPAYLTNDFDQNIDRVPRGFRGHNPVDLLKATIGLAARLAKSEYETDAQWKERTSRLLQSPFFGSMTPGSTFAVIIDQGPSSERLWTEYDAEEQRLNVFLQAKGSYVGKWRSVELIRTSHYGVYIGENTFGVKRRITKANHTVVELCYRVNDSEIYRGASNTEGLLVALEATPTEAIRIRKRLQAIAIFKLELPYFSEDSERLDPTITEPIDVDTKIYRIHAKLTSLWIYNTETREIWPEYFKPE